MSTKKRQILEIPISPVAKPRMTRRDRWKQRPVVQRYFAYKDQVRLMRVNLPQADAWCVFVIPIPKSWSKKKRARHLGAEHQQVPDVDNYIKGLLDAVYDDDSCVFDIRGTKIWGDTGCIVILEGLRASYLNDILATKGVVCRIGESTGESAGSK